MKLSARQKWSTIIERINKAEGYEKFRDDGYGQILEYSDEHKAFLSCMSKILGKKEFIDYTGEWNER